MRCERGDKSSSRICETFESLFSLVGKGKGDVKEKYAAASLYIALKDHNCIEALKLTRQSQRDSLRKAAIQLGEDLDEVWHFLYFIIFKLVLYIRV